MTGRRLVVATANPGKFREFRAILAEAPLELVALDTLNDVVLPEEGDDYEVNARVKAQSVAQRAGLVALGDDSGLEVAALGGAPGPHSARYGGEGLDDHARVDHLLSEMEACGDRRREACFVCVMALVEPAGGVTLVRGICPGTILDLPSGRGGFGYDPVFRPQGFDVSMAELPEAVKNRISHRGRALQALFQTSSWASLVST